MLQAPGHPAELEDQKVPDLSCILSFFLVVKSARLVMHFGTGSGFQLYQASFVCCIRTSHCICKESSRFTERFSFADFLP